MNGQTENDGKQSNNKLNPQLRDDIPVDTDHFEGKSHKRVANALYRIISDSQDGGFAIGLEGHWGSGKSTVIEIAKKDYFQVNDKDSEAKNGYLFFPFDVWAHQGEPLKRSFMECLIHHLGNIENSGINKDSWDVDLKKIKSQQQTIHKETVPEVPWYVYIMAGFGLIWPFLIMATYYFLHKNPNPEIWKAAIFGVIAILFPITYSLIEYNCRIEKNNWIKKLFRNNRTSPFKNVPVFPSLQFSKDQTKNREFTYTEGVDVSTIEFNSYFYKILEQIGNHKLVVILDNMDRLPEDELKEAWSSMRNFFTSEPYGNNADLLKKVFLIVPYDSTHLKLAFEENQHSPDENEDQKKHISKTEFPEGGFIEKTFKTTLSVPEPILVDWKGYFELLLNNAFGEDQIDSDTSHALYRFLDSYFGANHVFITPRRIKTFVNEIVVLYKRWGDEIPLKYLGLYVANKQRMSKNPTYSPETLLNPKSQREINDNEWLKYYLAIYYNVSPEKAFQVTLFFPILHAIQDADKKQIEKLQDNNPGFELVFEQVLDSNEVFADWVKNEEETINQWLSLSYINLWPVLEKRLKEKVVRAVENLDHGAQLLRAENDLIEGIESLFQYLDNNPKYFSLVPNKIIGHYEEKDEFKESPYDENLRGFLLQITTLAKGIFEKQEFKNILREIALPKEEEFCFNFANDLENQEAFRGISINDFDSPLSVNDLWDYLAEFSGEDQLTEEFYKVANHLLKETEQASTETNNFSKNLGERLKRLINGGNEHGEIYGLLPILIELKQKEDSEAKNRIDNLINSRNVFRVLGFKSIQATENKELLAKIIFEISVHEDVSKTTINQQPQQQFNPGFQFFNKILRAQEPFENLKDKMVEVASNKYQYWTFKLASNKDGHFNCFQKIALEIVENNSLDCNILEFFIENYNGFHFLENSYLTKKFLEQLNRKCSQVKIENEVNQISIDFLEDSFVDAPDLSKNLAELIKGKLQEYTYEKWEKVFDELSIELDFIEILIKNNYAGFLNVYFKDGLIHAFSKILNLEENYLDEFGDVFQLFPKALHHSYFNDFYSEIRKQLISPPHEESESKKEAITNTFKFFGWDLFKDATINKNGSANFLKNFVVPLISSRDYDSLSWIKDNSYLVKKALDNTPQDESKDQVIHELKTAYDQLSDDEEGILSIIEEIASNLDINLSDSGENQ